VLENGGIMKPTDLVIRIDVSDLPLIEAERIVKAKNWDELHEAIKGRTYRPTLEAEP
jgi:hypothetical protein